MRMDGNDISDNDNLSKTLELIDELVRITNKLHYQMVDLATGLDDMKERMDQMDQTVSKLKTGNVNTFEFINTFPTSPNTFGFDSRYPGVFTFGPTRKDAHSDISLPNLDGSNNM